jgi:sugar phosphate isomerase/epimerase
VPNYTLIIIAMAQSKSNGQGQQRGKIPLSCATSSLPPFPASSQLESPFNLSRKLQAISQAGFDGIELAFPDLVAHASQLTGSEVKPTDYDSICAAAESVRNECASLGLTVVMLQPFANWEGWEEGSDEQQDAQSRAEGWIRVMKSAGTDMIQVCMIPCLLKSANSL